MVSMCAHILCKCQAHTPKSPHPQFYTAGVEALKLPEEGTVRSAGYFLSSFINISRDPVGGSLQPVVAHNAETLVKTLMFCICKYWFTVNFNAVATHLSVLMGHLFKNFDWPNAIGDYTRIESYYLIIPVGHIPSLFIHLDWRKCQPITVLNAVSCLKVPWDKHINGCS